MSERRIEYPQLISTIEMIREKVVENGNDVKDIKKILNGNGHVGLVGKVQFLEDHAADCKNSKSKWADRFIDRGFQVVVVLAIAWLSVQFGLK